MNIQLTKKAKDQLDKNGYDKYPYVQVKLVNTSCSGASFSLAARREIEEGYQVEEVEGYKFVMRDSDAEMFKNIKVDYEDEGLNEGFRVTSGDSELGTCFIK